MGFRVGIEVYGSREPLRPMGLRATGLGLRGLGYRVYGLREALRILALGRLGLEVVDSTLRDCSEV